MSIQPVSNSIVQDLQSLYQKHAANFGQLGNTPQAGSLQPTASAAHASESLIAAFVVDINSTQSQQAPLLRESFFRERKNDLNQLSEALQSGDAKAIRQAYHALVALGHNGPFRDGKTFQRADRAEEFAAIGQAIQSGDLAGAQRALTALQSTFRRQGPLGPPTPAPVSTTASGAS